MIIATEKPCFQDVVCVHEIEKPASSNSSGFKSVLEKLRLRGVYTVGVTVEIKLRCQIPLECSGCCLKLGFGNKRAVHANKRVYSTDKLINGHTT